ncbi:MAG: glycosyltransferase family 39 protein [Thermodesulfobacteriota bacterium]
MDAVPNAERTKTLLWAAVIIIALISFFILLSDGLFVIFGFDTPDYILLARSMALGHGYAEINIPGLPAHTQYPPGLPLLLTPVLYLLGYNLMWMHIIILVSAFLSIYVIKRLFESEADNFLGIAIALLTLSNFYFISFTREILSEVPYTFFSLLAIIFFEKYLADDSRRRYLALFIAALAASYLTKMIGVTLYAGALTAIILKAIKEKRETPPPVKKILFFAVAAISPFLLLMARNALLSTGGNTYQAIFFNADYYNAESGVTGAIDLLTRLASNLNTYLLLPSKMIFIYLDYGRTPPLVFGALTFITTTLMLYGLLHELYKKGGCREFYVIFFFGLIIAWPAYGIGDSFRYLIPMIPFFYYYLFIGIRLSAHNITALLQKRPVERAKLLLYPCLILLALNLLSQKGILLTTEIARRVHESIVLLDKNSLKKFNIISEKTVFTSELKSLPPCFTHYLSSSYFLRSIMRPGDVATARKARLTALITGGYVLKFPFTHKSEKMLEFFTRENIDYVLIDRCYPETRDYIIPFFNENNDLFEMPDKNYLVFRFKGRDKTKIISPATE